MRRRAKGHLRRAIPGLLLLTVAAGSACAPKSKKAHVAGLSAEQMYDRGIELLESGKYLSAVEVLSEIDLRFSGTSEFEPLVKLAMADATFYQSNSVNLIEARQMYLDFVTLYGGHDRAPYAQFQAGVCSLKQVHNPSRDQTQTHAAYRELRQVQRRFPNSVYADAAQDMIRRAEANLAEHEFIVGRFYMKRKFYFAAAERFRNILDRYPEYGETEKVYFYLGQTLLLNDNEVEAKIFLGKVVSDYPGTPLAKEAQQALNGFDTALAP